MKWLIAALLLLVPSAPSQMTVANPFYTAAIHHAVAGSGTPFSPTDISGLAVWFKPESLSLNDGDPVDTWTDSSGNGRSAVQAFGPNQPVYKTGIINGMSVVRFDDNNDNMPTVYALLKPYTIFIVERFNHIGALASRRTLNSTSGNCLLSVSGRNNNNNAFVEANVSNFEAETNTSHIGRLSIQSSASSYFVDGTNHTDTTTSYTDWGTFALGDSSEPSSADIGEVIIYQGVTLTSQNFIDVENYLFGRWATPNPHP